jgi:hypothetical protein
MIQTEPAFHTMVRTEMTNRINKDPEYLASLYTDPIHYLLNKFICNRIGISFAPTPNHSYSSRIDATRFTRSSTAFGFLKKHFILSIAEMIP